MKKIAALICAVLILASAVPLAGCTQKSAPIASPDNYVLPPARFGARRAAHCMTSTDASTFRNIYNEAQAIAIVRVDSWQNEVDSYTYHTAVVEKVYKGELPEAIYLYQYGSSSVQGDLPIYIHGDRLLVFLTKIGYDDVYSCRYEEAMYAASFVLAKSNDGAEYVVDAYDTRFENSVSRLTVDYAKKDPEVYGEFPPMLENRWSVELMSELRANLAEADEVMADFLKGKPHVFTLSDFEAYLEWEANGEQ